MKRRSQKVIGYGSLHAGFFWHVHCHAALRKASGHYMMSCDRHLHPGFDFKGAKCFQCNKPMDQTHEAARLKVLLESAAFAKASLSSGAGKGAV